MTKKVKRIPKEVYEKLDLPLFTNVYTNPNLIVREIFWRRLDRLISLYDFRGKTILDLGCGEGILLPTLSSLGTSVYGIDINSQAAKKIEEIYKLSNVNIQNTDIKEFRKESFFDIVICADVLEHFYDLNIPVNCIYNTLKEDGHLLISVPTENFLYRIGRMIFRYKKPEDHYHSSRDIIEFIIKKGFKLIRRYGYPYNMPYNFSAFELCLFAKSTSQN